MASIKKVGTNRYRVRIYAGRDSHGRKQYPSRTITGTQGDAKKFAREWETKRDLGAQVTNAKLTLGEHLQNWLHRKHGHCRPHTIEHYKRTVEKHIPHELGSTKLSKVQPVDIQNFEARLINDGAGVPLVRYIHALLGNAFKEAKRLRLIGDNPVLDVVKPKPLPVKTNAMEPDQAKMFLDSLTDDDLIFDLALRTGLIPEEYLAVQWADFDFERCSVQVKRTVVFTKEGFRFQATKTKAGVRSVTFPSHLAQRLKKHRVRQNEEKLAAGRHYQDLGLVFATIIGTPIRPSNLTERQFRPALKRAGLPHFRLYDLRHTWFTLSIKAGGDIKSISQQGGHSDIETTLHYYHHVLTGMREDAMQRLENLLSGPMDGARMSRPQAPPLETAKTLTK